MWRFRLPVILGVVAFSGACVCVVAPTTGSLTVVYTFGGARCDAAGVDQIRVIATGTLRGDHADETVSCNAFRSGVSIDSLTPDTYQVTVDGEDASGQLLYSTANPRTVTVVAGGDEQVTVDVPAVTGDLTVYWRFPGDETCLKAGAASVDYFLYDPGDTLADSSTFACGAGGVSWTALDAGEWAVTLDARNAAGTLVYSGTATVPVVAGQANSYTVDLAAQ